FLQRWCWSDSPSLARLCFPAFSVPTHWMVRTSHILGPHELLLTHPGQPSAVLPEPAGLGQEPLQTAGGWAGSSCASSRAVLEVLLSPRKRRAPLSCGLCRQGMCQSPAAPPPSLGAPWGRGKLQ
uniref:Uncharacterized protein n=1 Tax=Junco hyemalis TaxID=40217 RepID=A0A8C5NMP1_JUNHY